MVSVCAFSFLLLMVSGLWCEGQLLVPCLQQGEGNDAKSDYTVRAPISATTEAHCFPAGYGTSVDYPCSPSSSASLTQTELLRASASGQKTQFLYLQLYTICSQLAHLSKPLPFSGLQEASIITPSHIPRASLFSLYLLILSLNLYIYLYINILCVYIYIHTQMHVNIF